MKTYNIPTENFSKFERKIKALARKANKLETPAITWTELGEKSIEYEPGLFIQVIQVQVSGTAPIINGWSFVAKIEPAGDGENLVYSYSDNLPIKYRTVKMNCDHCKQIRARKSVFVVENGGQFAQVGSTCLKDFTGHNSPQDLASIAEAIAELDDLSEFEHDAGFDHEPEMLKIEVYLAWVVKSIDASGWHSRSNGYRPTADDAAILWTTAHLTDAKLTQDERNEAQAALDWVQENWTTGLNDYQWNVVQATKNSVIPVRHIGIVASLIPAYRREMEQQRAAQANPSRHQGEIKKRQNWTGLTVTDIIVFEGRYGMSYMHKFADADDNVFVWTTGKRLEKGQSYSGKATVKAHKEYKGVAETVLTRAKFN